MSVYGGIEAGGTKFVCAVGSGPDDLRQVTRFATTTPEETIGKAVEFFRQQSEPLSAIGIGAFGPVDLSRNSPTFGYITSTPKFEWQQTDIRGALARALNLPVNIDTDVNAAALAEHRWGAAQGASSVLYLTVGTGIGGGVLIEGRPLHGGLHPEIGHMLVRRDPSVDPFPGICPFHDDCLEGLASGPAIQARWERAGSQLPADHPAWPLEAEYLAHGLVTCIYTLSPQKIILGGGVLEQRLLFPLVRARVRELINGYLAMPELQQTTDSYIVPPALGSHTGVLGALALARQLAEA